MGGSRRNDDRPAAASVSPPLARRRDRSRSRDRKRRSRSRSRDRKRRERSRSRRRSEDRALKDGPVAVEDDEATTAII